METTIKNVNENRKQQLKLYICQTHPVRIEDLRLPFMDLWEIIYTNEERMKLYNDGKSKYNFDNIDDFIWSEFIKPTSRYQLNFSNVIDQLNAYIQKVINPECKDVSKLTTYEVGSCNDENVLRSAWAASLDILVNLKIRNAKFTKPSEVFEFLLKEYSNVKDSRDIKGSQDFKIEITTMKEELKSFIWSVVNPRKISSGAFKIDIPELDELCEFTLERLWSLILDEEFRRNIYQRTFNNMKQVLDFIVNEDILRDNHKSGKSKIEITKDNLKLFIWNIVDSKLTKLEDLDESEVPEFKKVCDNGIKDLYNLTFDSSFVKRLKEHNFDNTTDVFDYMISEIYKIELNEKYGMQSQKPSNETSSKSFVPYFTETPFASPFSPTNITSDKTLGSKSYDKFTSDQTSETSHKSHDKSPFNKSSNSRNPEDEKKVGFLKRNNKIVYPPGLTVKSLKTLVDKRRPGIVKMQKLLNDPEVKSILCSSGISFNSTQMINSKVLEAIFGEVVSSKCSVKFALKNYEVISLVRIARVRDEKFLNGFLEIAYPDIIVYRWGQAFEITKFFGPLFSRKDLSEDFMRKFLYLTGDAYQILESDTLKRTDITADLKRDIIKHITQMKQILEKEEDGYESDEYIDSDDEAKW